MVQKKRSLFINGKGEGVTKMKTGLSRRRFLKTASLGMAIGFGLLGDFRAFAQMETPLDLDFNSIEGLRPLVTSNEDFYWVEKNVRAHSTRRNWKLKIEGLVEKELEFDLEQLKAMPAVEQYSTLECISNEVGGDLISTAQWKGVSLIDLLNMAGLKDNALDISFFADDGYSDSFFLQKATEPWVIVAYEMNGEPLPMNHGAPVRIIVPGIYGMKNVKYLNRIVPTDRDFKGYWERRGWDDLAIIKTTAIIDTPIASRTPLKQGD